MIWKLFTSMYVTEYGLIGLTFRKAETRIINGNCKIIKISMVFLIGHHAT